MLLEKLKSLTFLKAIADIKNQSSFHLFSTLGRPTDHRLLCLSFAQIQSNTSRHSSQALGKQPASKPLIGTNNIQSQACGHGKAKHSKPDALRWDRKRLRLPYPTRLSLESSEAINDNAICACRHSELTPLLQKKFCGAPAKSPWTWAPSTLPRLYLLDF